VVPCATAHGFLVVSYCYSISPEHFRVVFVCSSSSTLCTSIFWRRFVKRFALCYRTVVCPLCLSCLCCLVTLVYCDQMVGRIRVTLTLSMEVELGHIILDEDPALPNGKGPRSPLHFHNLRTQALRPYKPRPMSIVAKRLDGSGCHLIGR